MNSELPPQAQVPGDERERETASETDAVIIISEVRVTEFSTISISSFLKKKTINTVQCASIYIYSL